MTYYIVLKKCSSKLDNEHKEFYKQLKDTYGSEFKYELKDIMELAGLSENQVKSSMRTLKDNGAIKLMSEDTYLTTYKASKLNESGKGGQTLDNGNIVAQIEKYTANVELRETLKSFSEMRKRMKKPLTNTALNIILNKLDKWCAYDGQKIKMLERSIEHSWLTVYQEQKSKSKEQILSNLDYDYYNGLLVVEEDRQRGLKYAIDMANEPSYARELKQAKLIVLGEIE